ncbi:general transcription factor IIF subunit 2-like [Takifugu flavidus]|uniref:General transcription factor IIF subunit 2 n=2 Tax=Takifugu TaxID=31032 RepID=A0A5C6PED6_9TELE|nr:general transcription factor IIF subunit 2-like [Takifugu flavidus]TWW77369.1 General transcription factor IIF subunit 2 [Takifugu flavidus]|eukprot:XP_011616456.1 PREDICTED: general transcription factor IIF subunit 2-like isoform X2 [Takifugu rubripes]
MLNLFSTFIEAPSYLSMQLDKAKEGEVGNIQIYRRNERIEEVRFWLKKDLALVEGQENKMVAVPRKHSITVQPAGGQMLGVFSENSDDIDYLGKVLVRADCTPAYFDEYLRLKRLEKKKSPQKAKMLQIQSPIANYKPVSKHPYHREDKRKVGAQYTSMDKKLVMDLLFSAFEKHQYCNIKQLVDMTKQPVVYLKSILREIGVYNVTGTHKYTWELRPEYRLRWRE